MTSALRSAGWANYTLFLSDDGLLVGYLETDDYPTALQRMAQTGVNDRWQAEMAPYFADPGRPAARRRVCPAGRDLPPRLSAVSSARNSCRLEMT
jgi:L-rhamnose mutarotase